MEAYKNDISSAELSQIEVEIKNLMNQEDVAKLSENLP